MVSETCSFPDCGRRQKAKALKLCATHYSQHLKGQGLRPILKYGPICTFLGCERPHYAHGLCGRHRQQERDGQALTPNPEARKSPCSMAGCVRAHHARGFCRVHYGRWAKGGDPSVTSRIVGDDAARFWSKVNKAGTCWNWIGRRNPDGYGEMLVSGRYRGAHRLSYELAHGPIADGIEIDHRCHNRACQNPAHLRPVLHRQNMENLSGRRKNNSSGARGVSWYKASKKWMVKVGFRGKQVHVGYFLTLSEAEAAAIAKRNELYTHNDLDRLAA